VCAKGINKVITTHQLSHLTTVPVSLLLKSNQLTPDEIYWIKSIAGLNLKNSDRKGYGYDNGHGDGLGYGDGNGYGYDNGHGDGLGYGDGNGYGNGYGVGYGLEDGDGCGDGDGDGYGDGYGGVTRYRNQNDNQPF